MKYAFYAILITLTLHSCKKESNNGDSPYCDYGFEGGKCEIETAVKFEDYYQTTSPMPSYSFEIKRVVSETGHLLIKNVTNEGYNIKAEVHSGYMLNRDLTIPQQEVAGHSIKGTAYLNSISPTEITISLTIDGTQVSIKANGN